MNRLPRQEWDFSLCPRQEAECCLEYERTRTRPDVLDLVQKWRSLSNDKSFAGYLKISPDPLEWMDAKSAFIFYPEWPAKPYLAISAQERKNRLKHFTSTLPPEAIIRAYPVNHPLWPSQYLQYDTESGCFTNLAQYPYSEDILIQIPWGYSSDRDIIRAFEAMLKKLRPKKSALIAGGWPAPLLRAFSNYEKVGAGSPKRSIPGKLKKLGASRIYDHAGGSGCLDYPLRGYKDQAAYSRAKKASKSEISGPVMAACLLYIFLHSKNNS